MADFTSAFQLRQSGDVWVMTHMNIMECKNTGMEVQLQVTQNHRDKVQRTYCKAPWRVPHCL